MKATSFLAALVLVSSVAFANGPGTPRVVVVNQKNSGTFKVIYDGAKAGEVTMTITNSRGTVVYTETTEVVNGFIRPVNFTGMEAGEYTIEIADASGKQIQKIAYNNESSVRSVQVSKIKEAGKYLLAVANDGAEQINVRIFDGNNNLVHNQDLTIDGNFGLVYNLKAVAGVPTFEVTDKTGTIRTIKY